jgi:hypothetical protein
MPKWKLLGRLVAVECLLVASIILASPAKAFACTSCVTCDGKAVGSYTTCIAGNQAGYACGTPCQNTYCTWDCIVGPGGGLIVNNAHCQGWTCCSPDCWSCCP